MTDQPDLTKAGVSRRSLLKSAPAFAGALVSAAALPQTARAQTKLSHTVAKYQDQPKNGQKCSTCVQFSPPGSCKIVVDPISPNGWCQFYGQKAT
jgi:hypothetical protein